MAVVAVRKRVAIVAVFMVVISSYFFLILRRTEASTSNVTASFGGNLKSSASTVDISKNT